MKPLFYVSLLLLSAAPFTLSAQTINTGSSNQTISTPITANLIKQGSGTLFLTGTSPAAGSITVSAGTLAITAGGSVSSSTVSVGNLKASVGDADVSGTWTTSSNLTVGHGTLTIQNGGVVTVGGSALLSSATSASTLIIAGDTAPGVLNSASVSGAGTPRINFTHTGNDYHFTTTGAAGGAAVLITGITVVNHTGAGTTTLTGTNTYTGATTVSAGRLTINGSAANSAFTVNSNATLGGSGTVGALTIASGGTLAPGNSPGTLHAGNTTWLGGGSYAWQINDATGGAGAAGTNWDLLSITGTLNLSALTSETPFILSLASLTAGDAAGLVADFDATQNHAYTIATATGGITGFDASDFSILTDHFINDLQGGAWSLHSDGYNLNLAFTASAVPEPSTYAALLGLAALGLALWRRRRD